MNKIINRYLILNFLKIVFNAVLIFLALGIVLNLFEEIEFFKNLDQSLMTPFLLSLTFVPTLVIELLPFIIFLASMFFFLQLKSSRDLLSIKIFGYSNLKIILVLASFAFILGVIVLVAINPVTAALVKYYETEKAQYANDVDHLISINKNGVWIKENDDFGYKIINAEELKGEILKKISIYIFDNNNKILKRLESESALITDSPWIMKNTTIYDLIDNSQSKKLKSYSFETNQVLEKINSLYRNLNTISFIDLVTNYDELNKKGYSKKLLNEKINKFTSLPVFLFLMVILASIFTVGSIKEKQNFYYVLVSILISVIIYYFKDLSIALGQTNKIGLTLSIWIPVIVIGLFCSIGVIQINEK